jgi:squalene-hopene/tetraprenyl-beta-curcumene cyclase
MDLDKQAFEETRLAAIEELLAWRVPAGHWQGRLSSSALSTATAVFALAAVDKDGWRGLIHGGLDWLAKNVNEDGGWGDTTQSPSNISTTLLAWSAFTAGEESDGPYRKAIAGAESWLANSTGSLRPDDLVAAVARRYGNDRTFSAPILTMCALAGRLGAEEDAWRLVPTLPFELAICPHRWLKWLRLHVVSYGLPALIAIGQVHYHRRPPGNPLSRISRCFARRKTLDLLAEIQPQSGGYLEAIPLTSFVAMSLAAIGQTNHTVVRNAIDFLRNAVRDDGSWAIDANLATWVTTLSINALSVNDNPAEKLGLDQCTKMGDWLLEQQHLTEHPFTRADPGGWAWTDLTGGVPDADDTPGALLALRNIGQLDGRAIRAAEAGVKWLIGLQNSDGGIPTFCKGWGRLGFDQSTPDLTAHTLLAFATWLGELPDRLRSRVRTAISRGIVYLRNAQRQDGAWIPLWFGNALAENEQDPTYGTARVLLALQGLPEPYQHNADDMIVKGIRWLLSAQNADGGWGGAPGVTASIEETAVTIDALAKSLARQAPNGQEIESAVVRGVQWLIERTDHGKSFPPSPIGLYFAKLWYFERLYPLIFTVSSLERVATFAKLRP